MKSKILISLLVALVMLFTLAVPAFAGPVGDNLVPTPNAQGAEVGNFRCSAKIAVTHNNDIKVTVVLRGAMPGQTYKVAVYDYLAATWYEPNQWDLPTDQKGNARGSKIMHMQTAHGDGVTANFQVNVLRDSQTRLQWETPLPVDF